MPYPARKLKGDKSMALKRDDLKGCKMQSCKSCTHGEAEPILSDEEKHVEPKFHTVDGTPVAAYLMRRHRNTRQFSSDVEIR